MKLSCEINTTKMATEMQQEQEEKSKYASKTITDYALRENMEENCHKRRRATAHQNMGELRRMTSLKCEKHNAIVILTLSSHQEDMCSIIKA